MIDREKELEEKNERLNKINQSLWFENDQLLAEVASLREGLEEIARLDALSLVSLPSEEIITILQNLIKRMKDISKIKLSTPNKKAEDFIQQVRKETAEEIYNLIITTPFIADKPISEETNKECCETIRQVGDLIKQSYNLEGEDE